MNSLQSKKGFSFFQTAQIGRELRHVSCVEDKARFEPRTSGTEGERADHCATRPGHYTINFGGNAFGGGIGNFVTLNLVDQVRGCGQPLMVSFRIDWLKIFFVLLKKNLY